MGKKGNRGAHTRASQFLLKPELLPKIFGSLAERYADRPGGYTRIHKFGNRPGDNAPHAILELVDNPRDLRWEITSRAIGWEMLREKLKKKQPVAIINAGAEDTLEVVDSERRLRYGESGVLRPKTRWNLQKILRHRDQGAVLTLSQKVGDYMVSPLIEVRVYMTRNAKVVSVQDHLLATPTVFKAVEEEREEQVENDKKEGRPKLMASRVIPHRNHPGQAVPGETRGALDLARGALGHRKPEPEGTLLNVKSMFGLKYENA